MSLTTAQHDILVKYLKDCGIGYQEPFEEFYDHIATAIEKDKPDDLKEYFREVIQPSFVGVQGMLRIVSEQSKIRRGLILKRAKEIFLSLFGWPAIGFVMVSFILLQTAARQFGGEYVMYFSLILGLSIPPLVIMYGAFSFSRDCKKRNLPYRSNDLNATIFSLLVLPYNIFSFGANLLVFIVLGRENLSQFLSAYPVVTICFSTLVLLFGFTCLKLFKEKFIFKLTVR
jgi:hypothetical protein